MNQYDNAETGGFKVCSRCDEQKQTSQFSRGSYGRTQSWCKQCYREYHLERKRERTSREPHETA